MILSELVVYASNRRLLRLHEIKPASERVFS
nr:MAG TPA: hypothetical protein [Caudoviricetes sp.]